MDVNDTVHMVRHDACLCAMCDIGFEWVAYQFCVTVIAIPKKTQSHIAPCERAVKPWMGRYVYARKFQMDFLFLHFRCFPSD